MLNIFNRNRTKYRDSGWSSENDTFWTKIAKRLNYFMNPEHQWTDYEAWNENSTINKVSKFVNNALGEVGTALSGLDVTDQLQSFINSQTGAHLTGSQIEANQLQMQNAHDIYQQQVSGMKDAGLNPALMYQSGAQQAPSVQGSQGTGSMSEVMQAMLFDRQAKLLDAQTRNTDADTDKKSSETEYQKLVNQYFPGMKSVELDKLLSEIGVNEESIKKIKSETASVDLDRELKAIEKVIKHAESDESSAYYKARREYLEAQTDKERQEKKKLVEETAMAVLEKDYMKHTNTKMGSAQIIALAAGIGTLLSDTFGSSEGSAGWNPEMLGESLKRDLRRLIDWINKEKKAPWVE